MKNRIEKKYYRKIMKILKIGFIINLLVYWSIMISCTSETNFSTEMNGNSHSDLNFHKINQEFMMNKTKRSSRKEIDKFVKLKNHKRNYELDSKEMKIIEESFKKAFTKLKDHYRTVVRSRFG